MMRDHKKLKKIKLGKREIKIEEIQVFDEN